MNTLDTKDGLIAFIETTLLQDIVKVHAMGHGFRAMGMVVTKHDQKKPRSTPVPITLGGPEMSARDVKRQLRQVAKKTRAAGVLFAEDGEFTNDSGLKRSGVVVRMEHTQFGDLAWVAPRPKNGGPLEFGGVSDLTAAGVEKTRFLPARYMD